MFGKSLSTNRRGLQLLIDTLAPLVPYESVEYMKVLWRYLVGVNSLSVRNLQVHLDVMSNRSDRSLSVVADYITLIRTRLLDLGGFPAENSEFAASLVQQAVEEFGRTGNILSKVTEASVFRSPFYVRCFLPLLLSPTKKDGDQKGLVEKLFRYVIAFSVYILIFI